MLVYQRVNLQYIYIYPILFHLSYPIYPAMFTSSPSIIPYHSTSQRPLAFCVTPSGLTMAVIPKRGRLLKKICLTIHPPKKKVNFSGSWSDPINYHSKLTSFFYIIHNWLFRLDLKIAEALENYSGFRTRIQIYWIRPNSTSERKFSHPSVSAILNQ